jgi:hypothetical protein
MVYEVIGLGLLCGLFLGTGLGYCIGGLIGSWRRVRRADRVGGWLGLTLGTACAIAVGFLIGAHRHSGAKDVLLWAPMMALIGGGLGGVLAGFGRPGPPPDRESCPDRGEGP